MDLPNLKAELLGVVESPIKLAQDKWTFDLSVVTFQWGFLYISWPPVLSLNILKIRKTKAVKNICIQVNLTWARDPIKKPALGHVDFDKL